MKKEWYRKFFLNAGISGAILILLIILIVFLQSDINKRVAKIAGQRQELIIRTAAIESLATLKADSAKAGPYIEFLNKIFPSKEELIGFSKFVSDIAIKNQTQIGITFGQEEEGSVSAPGALNFYLSVNATLGRFQNFLKDLNADRYIVELPSLDLSRQNEERFVANFSGKVFSR
jgi:hypothetical protein